MFWKGLWLLSRVSLHLISILNASKTQITWQHMQLLHCGCALSSWAAGQVSRGGLY